MLHKSRCIKAVVAALPLLAVLSACGERNLDKGAKAQQTAALEKYAKAKALFEERCKMAGVVIKRTVKDVEGIELTKIRQPIPWGGKEYFDPMFAGAAMAGEMQGEYFVKQFLMSEFKSTESIQQRGPLAPPTRKVEQGMRAPLAGYRFVELVDATTKSRRRCELELKPGEHSWEKTPLHCEPVATSATRFALDYLDFVDPGDRSLWVAGTKLSVRDKDTGEVIAEYIKYVWDPGFGEDATGRWPWQHADGRSDRNCPTFQNRPIGTDGRYFVDTVLVPAQGE